MSDQRLRQGLLALLYAYYRSTRGMLENVHRDEPLSPAVATMFRGFRDYLEAARDALMAQQGRARTQAPASSAARSGTRSHLPPGAR